MPFTEDKDLELLFPADFIPQDAVPGLAEGLHVRHSPLTSQYEL
jgi:hypothetical protein